MIGLMFSMPSEAKFFIEHFNARLTYEQHGLRLYDSQGILIAVSGIGAFNAALAVQHSILRYPTLLGLVNIGICGCARPDIEIGSLFHIHEVKSADNLRPIYPDLLFDSTVLKSSLTTFSAPVTIQTALHENVDLVDMEGYGFAFAANKFLSPHRYQILKIVSDHLEFSHINREFVYQMMEGAANEILKFISNFRDHLESVQTEPNEIESSWKEFFEANRFTVSQKSRIAQHLKHKKAIGSPIEVPSKIPTFEHAKERNRWVEQFIKEIGT